MKGLLLRNEGLFIMNGEVIGKEEREDGGLEITVRYYEHDYQTDKPVEERTKIMFQNQKSRSDDKPLVPYADIAKKMDIAYGSKILAVVTFPGRTNEIAQGYRIKKSGIMSFRDETGQVTGSVISGYVTGYSIDKKMNWVIFHVTAEPNKAGVPDRYNIVFSNNAMARKALEELTPKQGAVVRAAFRVGQKIDRPDDTSIYKQELYPCGLYDIMDIYKKGE